MPSNGTNLFWTVDPSSHERAMVEAWIGANDCSGVAVLAISRTVVAAFDSDMDRSGTTERRDNHEDLLSALTVVVARLRRRQ